MSHEEEIAKLRAENARLDRLAWDYRGEITQAQEEIALLRAENAALQNEARQIWAQIPDEYKLSSGERSPEATRLMVKGLWAMSEELRALRAENASLDRIATDYYERLTGEAQEEIARLQSGIAALREQWQARYDAWKVEFDEEMQKAGRAERSLILAGQRYAMACVLEELDAIFPAEAINEEKAP